MMTEHEARSLYVRLANSFPGEHRGVAAETWIEVLTDLDAGIAGTTILRLRDELERPPSIAQFKRRYYALRAPLLDTIHHTCHMCGQTGWRTITGPDGDPILPATVRPCTCPHGQHAETVHRMIDDHRRDNRQGQYRPRHDDATARPADLSDDTLFGDNR